MARTRTLLAVTVLLAARWLAAGEPSWDVSEKDGAKAADRTLVVASAAELATLGVTGHGAREVAAAVVTALKDKPAGTRVRVIIGTTTEGSTRWTYVYPRSVVALDEKDRSDGTEYIVMGTWTRQTRQVPWKHGVRDGIEREFDGPELKSEVPWKDGKMDGIRKAFWPGGKLESETPYVDGVANGLTRSWTREGELAAEGTMKDGKRDGLFTEYWPGGKQPKRTISYVKGVVDGPVREYYQSGKIKKEQRFSDDTLDGQETLYNEDGTVAQVRYWFRGDRVSREEYEKRRREEQKTK